MVEKFKPFSFGEKANIKSFCKTFCKSKRLLKAFVIIQLESKNVFVSAASTKLI